MSLQIIENTLARLSELIDQDRFEELETDTLEIKPVPPTGGEWKERYKSANAFLNTRGGILLLGIKESGSGLERRYVHTGWTPDGENLLKELPKRFTSRDGKPVDVGQSFPPPQILEFRSSTVAVQFIDELPADRKFVFFDGQAYRRVLTGDHKLTSQEIDRQEEYREEALQARELQTIPGLGESGLSLERLNDFIYQLNQPVRVETMKTDMSQARPFLVRRSFLVDGKVTTLGALVCAQHPGDVLGFRAHAHCYVDAPQEVARDKQDFVGSVLQLMDSSLGYLLRNTQRGISARQGGISVLEYPEELLRETVNNALAHRDYAIDRQVIVAVKPGSHVSIQNPGAFRPHLLIERPDDPVPLRRILPEAKPRNPKLADVLRVFRKWEGRGIGMATLVDLCLANRIDLPYYSLKTQEVGLFLCGGKLLDDRMERLFKGFDRYIGDKLDGGVLTSTQKLVLSYVIKSEWANEQGRYTVLLTPDNNHFAELRALEQAGLISKHSASTAHYPVFVPDRTLVRKSYTPELRELFGTRFDSLAPFQKEVLGVVFRFIRYSRESGVSAKEASFELWAAQGGPDNIKAFDAFYRKTRRAFNDLEKSALVEKRAGTHGFGLRQPTGRRVAEASKPRTQPAPGRPPKTARQRRPFQDLARQFFSNHGGRQEVDVVRESIGLPDSIAGRNQARNILVRLCTDGVIRRLSPGAYERVAKKS